MSNYNLTKSLIDTLFKCITPVYLNSTKTEIMIRCPYCGDSVKSESHAHLYIGLESEYGFPYYCQKCLASGVVNKNFLKDIGIVDFELISEVEKTNRISKSKLIHYKKNINGTKNNQIQLYPNIILPEFNESKLSYKKLDYINNRFSFDLEPNTWIDKYKVIFSFKDFLEVNNIDNFICSEYMLKNLMKNYVGFLTVDKGLIVFRNILPDCEKKYRYYNYNIFNNNFTKKFYVPKCNINLLTKKLNIIITEGIFDIIGVREYFYKDYNSDDTIFIAVNGKGFNLIFNYISRLGFINTNIIIYSDSDVSLQKYRLMRNNCNLMKYNNVKIYYNSIDKDYGTHLENIKLKYCTI